MPSVKYDLPLLPLRDVVVFPGNVTTLFVGREPSINALNQAMAANKKILLGTQIDGSIDNPSFDEIYKVQTLATILQLIKLPDGTVKLLVEGDHRCELDEESLVRILQEPKNALVDQYKYLFDLDLSLIHI